MSINHQIILSSRIVLLFCLVLSSSALAADKPKLPEGPGKAATIKACGSCHAAELVMNRRESIDGWNGVVEDMLRRGMKASDEELGEVVDYLVAHFPKTATPAKINVNKATAKDLAAALGLTDDQAAAIVQHREAKGKFTSIEDLQKVAGVDAAVIEAKKAKLEF